MSNKMMSGMESLFFNELFKAIIASFPFMNEESAENAPDF
jgi:hypothetical protein